MKNRIRLCLAAVISIQLFIVSCSSLKKGTKDNGQSNDESELNLTSDASHAGIFAPDKRNYKQLESRLIMRVGKKEWTDHNDSDPGMSLLLSFKIPDTIELKPGVFKTELALKQYLARKYFESDKAGDPSGTNCTSNVNSKLPPNIQFALPSSGGAYMPVGIVGSNFEDPTVPLYNGIPGKSLFNFGIKNIPFIGCVVIGYAEAPTLKSNGKIKLKIKSHGRFSNEVELD